MRPYAGPPRALARWALALCVAAFCAVRAAAQEGWRMTDRFAGFRFECRGSAFDREAFAVRVRDAADEYAGFGWVQVSPSNSIVGEFRGNRQTAVLMKAFLERGPEDKQEDFAVLLRDYPDTKIRFHFSHFKIMDRRRKTCFVDEPHKCEKEL